MKLNSILSMKVGLFILFDCFLLVVYMCFSNSQVYDQECVAIILQEIIQFTPVSLSLIKTVHLFYLIISRSQLLLTFSHS